MARFGKYMHIFLTYQTFVTSVTYLHLLRVDFALQVARKIEKLFSYNVNIFGRHRYNNVYSHSRDDYMTSILTCNCLTSIQR